MAGAAETDGHLSVRFCLPLQMPDAVRRPAGPAGSPKELKREIFLILKLLLYSLGKDVL
jgi:hypothetical protein